MIYDDSLLGNISIPSRWENQLIALSLGMEHLKSLEVSIIQVTYVDLSLSNVGIIE